MVLLFLLVNPWIEVTGDAENPLEGVRQQQVADALTLDPEISRQPSDERGRDGVPEMQERVFVQADVHEHRLEALLDVAHAALEDAADDVLVAFALDGVFLQHAVLEECDAAFEFLDIDDNAVATGRIRSADAQQSFDALNHVGDEVSVFDGFGKVRVPVRVGLLG